MKLYVDTINENIQPLLEQYTNSYLDGEISYEGWLYTFDSLNEGLGENIINFVSNQITPALNSIYKKVKEGSEKTHNKALKVIKVILNKIKPLAKKAPSLFKMILLTILLTLTLISPVQKKTHITIKKADTISHLYSASYQEVKAETLAQLKDVLSDEQLQLIEEFHQMELSGNYSSTNFDKMEKVMNTFLNEMDKNDKAHITMGELAKKLANEIGINAQSDNIIEIKMPRGGGMKPSNRKNIFDTLKRKEDSATQVDVDDVKSKKLIQNSINK